MAVFGWIGHSELQRKIPGGINFAFLFSGGLKKRFYKFRGALFIALFLSGGLFQIKDGFGAQQKNPGGLHDLLENSWGPIIITGPDLKRPPGILKDL